MRDCTGVSRRAKAAWLTVRLPESSLRELQERSLWWLDGGGRCFRAEEVALSSCRRPALLLTGSFHRQSFGSLPSPSWVSSRTSPPAISWREAPLCFAGLTWSGQSQPLSKRPHRPVSGAVFHQVTTALTSGHCDRRQGSGWTTVQFLPTTTTYMRSGKQVTRQQNACRRKHVARSDHGGDGCTVRAHTGGQQVPPVPPRLGACASGVPVSQPLSEFTVKAPQVLVCVFYRGVSASGTHEDGMREGRN